MLLPGEEPLELQSSVRLRRTATEQVFVPTRRAFQPSGGLTPGQFDDSFGPRPVRLTVRGGLIERFVDERLKARLRTGGRTRVLWMLHAGHRAQAIPSRELA